MREGPRDHGGSGWRGVATSPGTLEAPDAGAGRALPRACREHPAHTLTSGRKWEGIHLLFRAACLWSLVTAAPGHSHSP